MGLDELKRFSWPTVELPLLFVLHLRAESGIGSPESEARMQLAALHVVVGGGEVAWGARRFRNGNSWQRRNIKSFYLRLPASCHMPHPHSAGGGKWDPQPSAAQHQGT